MGNWGDQEDDGLERVLAQTTVLLLNHGDEQAVALLMDVRTVTLVDSDEEARTYPNLWNDWVTDYFKVVMLDVEDHLVDRFTDEVVDRILPTLIYVAGRNGIEDVKFMQARPVLPEVDGAWREICAAHLATDRPTNQGRRERGLPKYPTEDGLTFASQEELRVYRVLKQLQMQLPEDDTIAIVPLPGTRLRTGTVRTPDFLVSGRGKALIIEVDGPHHRERLRVVDDRNLDLQYNRCGMPVVRLAVEDIEHDDAIRGRLCEEFRRHLPPARRAA